MDSSSLQPQHTPKTDHYSHFKFEESIKPEEFPIKSDEIYCFKCKDSSLTPDSLIELDCQKCRICSACIFTYFNESLVYKVQLYCQCKAPIPYRFYKTHIQEGDLIEYIGVISSSAFILPDRFYCKNHHLNKLTNKNERFIKCDQESGTIYCIGCLETHDSSITCLEYYHKNKPKCLICRTKFAEPGTPCECLLCNGCKLENFKDQLSSDPLNNPHCEVCYQTAIERDLSFMFNGRDKLIKYKEDVLLGSKFSCPICYREKPVDGSITLDCKDRFCKKCIKDYMKTFLANSAGNASKIKCPKCNQDIIYHIITFVLDKFWIDLYEKRLLRNLERKSKEYMKFCNNCDYGAYIAFDAEQFQCPKCNKTICPKCNKFSSPTCCSFGSLSSMEPFKSTLVRCPECKLGILKETGCNFITCLWNECKGISFCFLCKKVLSEDEHFSHYKRTGPFGNSCNTLDKIDI